MDPITQGDNVKVPAIYAEGIAYQTWNRRATVASIDKSGVAHLVCATKTGATFPLRVPVKQLVRVIDLERRVAMDGAQGREAA